MLLLFVCSYNKREFDFPSLRDYNDYLEQVEDIGRNRKASVQCLLIKETSDLGMQVPQRTFSLDGLSVTINLQVVVL